MNFDPSALARQLEASAKLLRIYGDPALRLARDWNSPLRSGGGRGPKGDHADPTCAAAEEAINAEKNRYTLPYRYFDALQTDATIVSDHLRDLIAVVVELGRAAAPERSRVPVPERKPGVGAGQCQACNTWVSGSAEDRLRSGFCDACRKAWDRAGRPDRSVFKRSASIEPDDGIDILERLNPGHDGSAA